MPMKAVAEIMTSPAISVAARTGFKEIVRLMQAHDISAVPVVDEDGFVMGVVSEHDLLLKEDSTLVGEPHLFEGVRRRTERAKASSLVASDLMSWPAVSIESDATVSEAARLMHRKHVKRLPVLDPKSGTIVGVVSRADLLKVFLRRDAKIAAQIREDVIRRTLWIDPDTIRVLVDDGVVSLDGEIERRSLIPTLERLVMATEGVVGVKSRLSYAIDDVSARTAPLPFPLPLTSTRPKARDRG